MTQTADMKMPLSPSQRMLFALMQDSKLFHTLNDRYGETGWQLFVGKNEQALAAHIWQQSGLINVARLERQHPVLFQYTQWLNIEAVSYDDFYVDAHVFGEMQDALEGEYVKETYLAAANALIANPQWTQDEIKNHFEGVDYTVYRALNNIDGLLDINDAIAEARQHSDQWKEGNVEFSRLPFCLEPMRQRVIGWPRGALGLLLGATGTGKTAYALQEACTRARLMRRDKIKGVVLYETLEVPAYQTAQRMASNIAEVDLNRLMRNIATPAEWERYEAAYKTLENLPLKYGQTPNMTVTDLWRKMRRLMRQFGRVDCVFIDFGRLMQPDEKNASEARRTELLMYGLHGLVRNFKNPDGTYPALVVVGEMNREGQKRQRQTDYSFPHILDLKMGGEYAASLVLAMHDVHDTFYSIDTQAELEEQGFIYKGMEAHELAQVRNSVAGMAWCMVLKNRNGRTGLVEGLKFVREFTRWEKWSA